MIMVSIVKNDNEEDFIRILGEFSFSQTDRIQW